MLRPQGRHTGFLLVASLLLLPAIRARAEGPEAVQATDRKAAAAEPTGAPRVNIFLGGPGAIDTLLKSLEHPDFVLMKGDEFQKQLERAAAAQAEAKAPSVVVDSVSIEGKMLADRAELSIIYGATLRSEGPAWVPIRLDEQTVTGASEGDLERPLRVSGGGWQVELRGAGVHRVRVDLKIPLRSTLEGHRIDFAIPEAASTRFTWEVDRRVTDAFTGNGELVDVEPLAGRASTRLSAHLTPRARIDVSWRVEADPGAQLPPLLTMQGEIAIDVDPGSLRTRSTWAVHAVRGTTRSLELRVDPADEILELELDGQPVPAGIERNDGATLLTIALFDPLRPGAPKSLVMTTRRPIAMAATGVIAFNGFTLTNAKEQSGAIGIAQSGNLWVTGKPGRGVRRIDPRTELPHDLRVRPSTALAYVFADQPFELGLRVDPSPPLVRAEARTTVTLEASQARVETRLDYQPAPGRLFDMAIGLPPGLELESVGPKEVVEASQRDAPAAGEMRVVTVRLTPQAQEAGAFTIELRGRQAIDPARPVDLALFRPLDAASGGGRVAVSTGRNLTVELRDDGNGVGEAEADGERGRFRNAPQGPPSDWLWPAEHSTSDVPALWLRQDGSPSVLPLNVTLHRRSLSSRTSLTVEIGRRGIVTDQETDCIVHFGTLDHVDVEVPGALRGRWELEGSEVTTRTELGSTAGGAVLARLGLGREVPDTVRLRFRIRTPLPSDPVPGRPLVLPIPWIRVVDAKPMPMQVHVASELGVDVKPDGTDWSHVAVDEQPGAGDTGPPVRFTLMSDAPDSRTLSLLATAQPLAELPPLVASRLWLRTVQGPEFDLRTAAVYRVETHESSLSVELPPGAAWVRAKVGGTTVEHVEQLPKASGYRLDFPERLGTGPLVVELEYTVAAPFAAGSWVAPRLLGGGLVQQTLWEVRLPWGRAVVGVPRGWIDENTWAWDRYYFRRRPWQGTAALAYWAAGPSAGSTVAEGLDEAGAGDGPCYLFGRPGAPTDLLVRVASRGLLVGICSGSVLVLGGLLILFRRPSPRLAWGAALALGLMVATLVQPSVTFLAVQSALLGVVLTLLTALMQRLVHRRRPRPVFGESGAMAGAVSVGSSVGRAAAVGSDDSTAIRIRPISTATVDHYSSGVPSHPDREGATGRVPQPE